MIYAVDVPYVTNYTYWVDAENEKEAIAKAKAGDIVDVEETGEVTGKTLWHKATAHEDTGHKGKC